VIVYDYSTFRALFATTATPDVTGYEEWPFAEVRSGGFDDGFTGIDTPIAAFPIEVDVGGGVDHHAYLSQRTDDTALQYLEITEANPATDAWTIALTAKCVSDLGLALTTSPVTEDQLRRILANVTLYVQRISDNAIQFVNILDVTLDE
jgi:hypothetical protein